MATGTVSAYDLTNGVIVNMDEAIYLYTPEDLPLLTGMGADGLSVIASAPVDQIEFKWQDEEYLPPRSELIASATTDEAEIRVTTTERIKFSTGDVLMVRKANGDEIIRVTGYSATTSDTLLVTRGLVGTKTNYVTGAIVIGLGTALPEGSDPEDFRHVDRTSRTNVTQIFGPTKIQMTGTALVVPRYGVPNEWAHQLHARTFENGMAREQAFVYGGRYNSTTTEIRTTGGLRYFITTNVNSTATTAGVTELETAMQGCYVLGGVPDRLMGNPLSMSNFNDTTNESIVRVTLDDARRGRVRVSAVETEYGTVSIVRNRYVHPVDLFGFRRENVRRRVMRPLIFEPLAKTGDSQKGQLVCEEGLEVKGEAHAFRFSNLTGYTGA